MKFILIASALNLQLTYPTEDICSVALDTVKQRDTDAFCIPAPEDHVNEIAERIHRTGLMILHKKMAEMIAEEEKTK